MIMAMSVNGEPAVGFYNTKENKLQLMSVVHFELLLNTYMKTYVKPVRKN
jgi:hypothetical protein